MPLNVRASAPTSSPLIVRPHVDLSLAERARRASSRRRRLRGPKMTSATVVDPIEQRSPDQGQDRTQLAERDLHWRGT